MSDLRALGPFYADVVAVDPPGAESAAYRLRTLAPALPFQVDGARLVPSSNNDVWRLDIGYLRVSWRGDRRRLAREAVLFAAIKDAVPVPEILDYGGDSRLAWSLSAPVPDGPLDGLCTLPVPAGARELAREVAGLLRTLHSCPVPDEFAAMLTSAEEDPLRSAGSEFALMPPSDALGLVPVPVAVRHRLHLQPHRVLAARPRRDQRPGP